MDNAPAPATNIFDGPPTPESDLAFYRAYTSEDDGKRYMVIRYTYEVGKLVTEQIVAGLEDLTLGQTRVYLDACGGVRVGDGGRVSIDLRTHHGSNEDKWLKDREARAPRLQPDRGTPAGAYILDNGLWPKEWGVEEEFACVHGNDGRLCPLCTDGPR